MSARRRWTLLLWALALVPLVGIATQGWLLPGRTRWPVVEPRLHSPLVLLTVAGLRADHVGHLGYGRDATPRLDEIARAGASFAWAYSASNDDLASTAALLTSRCPATTGVHGPGDVLDPSVETLAERLAQRGYRCVALLGSPDLARAGLQRGFHRFEVLGDRADPDALLDQARQELAGGSNVFVWVDLSDLRRPYGDGWADLRAFAPDMPDDFGGGDPPAEHLDVAALTARGWGARQRRWLADRYDAALLHLDGALGRFADGLAEDFVLETMTLLVTGTRGERLDDRPGLDFTHGVDLYEHSVRVPLVMRLPARHIRRLVLPRLASSIDVAPTVLEMVARAGAAAEAWPAAEGRSLEGPPRVDLIVEGRHAAGASRARAIVMVVNDRRYKLIAGAPGGRQELYFVDEDTAERNELAASRPLHASALATRLADAGDGCGGP